MTDDIQKVREAALNAYLDSTGKRGEISVFSDEWDAFILDFAKRLQPRPEPVEKTWSVSDETGRKFQPDTASAFLWAERLNLVAPDIIRERPDLVKADLVRRLAAARLPGDLLLPRLFPELDP